MAMVAIHNHWKGLPKVLVPYNASVPLAPSEPDNTLLLMSLLFRQHTDTGIRRIIERKVK